MFLRRFRFRRPSAITLAFLIILVNVVFYLRVYKSEDSRGWVRSLRDVDTVKSENQLPEPFDPRDEAVFISNESTPQPQQQLAPDKKLHRTSFKASLPRKLIIVTYQRAGSSFFGRIFHNNPDVFFVSEPLDALFSHLYGTPDGGNVPSDVIVHINGTRRAISDDETAAAASMMADILDCRFDDLPVDFLTHSKWEEVAKSTPSWEPYRSCLKQSGVLKARQQCWETHLNGTCSYRFGLNLPKQDTCKRLLRALRELTSGGNRSENEAEMRALTDGYKTEDVKAVQGYHTCLQDSRFKVTPCIQMMTRKCREAPVRIVKTLRASMAQVLPLLERVDNLRVAHMFRDPRAVVRSRSKNRSSMSIYAEMGQLQDASRESVVKEAEVYCAALAENLLASQRHLVNSTDSSIIQLLYEDFVTDPLDYAKAFYQYLDMAESPAVTRWLSNNRENENWQRESRQRMNNWKYSMTYMQGERITSKCLDLYKLVPYS